MKRRKILIIIMCIIVLLGISMAFMKYRNTTRVAERLEFSKENIESLDTESSNDDEMPSV